jgi:pyruvate dehydrogenase complex dehydrogenase (E1) component
MMECVRRRVPDLQGQGRRLCARALLQHARAASAGRRLDRRPGLALNRGGHDIFKIFAAYKAAIKHKGQPTLILAKTIKGFGMGQAGEAMNISHQQKKMDKRQIRRFRDRFGLPVPDDKLEELPYLKFAEDSPNTSTCAAPHGPRRLPAERRRKAEPLAGAVRSTPSAALLKASGEGRELSTTMAIVRIMNTLLKDKQIGKNVVPIVPDESAPSAWKACSASTASGTRKARSTCRKTMTS